MVKIKTNNDDSSKNTLALKSNFEELLKTLKQTNSLLASQPTKTKTSITSKNDDKKSLAKEIAQELNKNKSISEFKQIAYGSILGISPALIEKLSIDKVIHTVAKHSWNKITGLFKSNKDDKLGSAIEANKQTPVTQRLDAIYQELKSRRKNEKTGVEEQKKTTGLLGFIGKVLNSGLIKALAVLGTLVGISHAIFWIARKLGWRPNQKPYVLSEAGKATLNAVGSAERAAAKALNVKNLQDAHFTKISATTKAWEKAASNAKISGSDMASLISNPDNIKTISKKYNLSNEQAANLLRTRNEQVAALDALKAEEGLNAAQRLKVTSKVEQASLFNKLMTKGGMIGRSALSGVGKAASRTARVLNTPGVAEGLDAVIYGWDWAFSDDKVKKEVSKRMTKKAIVSDIIGGTIGALTAIAIGELTTGGTATAAIAPLAKTGWTWGSFGASALVHPTLYADTIQDVYHENNLLTPHPGKPDWIERNIPFLSRGYRKQHDYWAKDAAQELVNVGFFDDIVPSSQVKTPVRKDEQLYEIDSTSGTIAASDQKNPAEDLRTEARTTNTTLDNIFDLLQQYLDPNGYRSRFMTKIDPATGQALPGQSIAGLDNMQIASINYIINRGH